jgi:RNA polymerase sigma factor (sigma-70 family)
MTMHSTQEILDMKKRANKANSANSADRANEDKRTAADDDASAVTDNHAAADDDTVAKFLIFQQTGLGFDELWGDLQPIVAEFSRRTLRKLGVRVRTGDGAVGDVESQTVVRLLNLSAAGARGRFDPLKASRPGISGFRGWLWRVVANEAATWARNERGSRRIVITPESGLGAPSEWNEPATAGDGPSILKRQVAKLVRPDPLPILEECINQFEDPDHREVVRLQLDEGLSQRQMAERLKTSPTTVFHRLHAAYKHLRPLLEDRGIDESWLAA